MAGFLETFFHRDTILASLPDLLSGLSITFALALTVTASGIPAGLGLAVLRSFRFRTVNFFIVLFADLFRALPPLVILVLIYFALPYAGIQLSGFAAAWLGLSLTLAAFSEEIFWAAILSVDAGQWEAARSTGLSRGATLLEVVLPQAVRLALPPLTNRTIAVGKATALASVIAVPEVLNRALGAQAHSANPSPLTLAALLYVALFLPLVLGSRWLESRFAWRR